MNPFFTRSPAKAWLLGCGLAAVALAAGRLHLQALGSMRERERVERSQIAELDAQLAGAQQTIEEIQAMEQRAAAARRELDRWRNGHPAGPAIVWFPVWLKEQLNRFGIVEAQIRLNAESPEVALPGFKRTYWNVNLPPQDGMGNMNAVLRAVEEIAHQERFVKVLDCSFQTGAERPSWPAGGFNVEALVRE